MTIERLLAGGPPAAELADPTDLNRAFLERATAEGLVDVAYAVADTPIGPLFVAVTERGLVRISFGRDDDEVLDELATRLSPRVLAAPARTDDVRRQLDEYFAGRREAFDVDLDRSLSHGFRRKVLEELANVGYGHVTSYRALAEQAGNPKASRAVGTAMATNPIPIVVPCHRVLRTGGGLGGYGGGLDAKRWLLQLEGVTL